MEADGGLAGEPPGQRAEPAERSLGRVLVELPDGRRDLRLWVRGCPPRGLLEGLPSRDRSSNALEPDAVQEQLADATALRAPAKRLELAARRKLHDFRRRGERWDEARKTARELRVEEIAGEDRVGRVGLGFDRRPPRGFRVATLRPQASEAEVELNCGVLRVELRQLLDSVERALRPGCERRPDLRLERIVSVEESGGLLELSLCVERAASDEVARLGIVAEPQSER